MEHDLSGFEDLLEEKQVLSEELENEDGIHADQPSHATNDGVCVLERRASREQRRRTRDEDSQNEETKPRLNAALLAEHRLRHNT